MRQRYSIALHRAARAGGRQLGAQFLGTGTALRPDVDPRPTHAAAREPVVQDPWLPPAQDGRVLVLKLTIGGERRRIRGALPVAMRAVATLALRYPVHDLSTIATAPRQLSRSAP
jgi:hypothetical protein